MLANWQWMMATVARKRDVDSEFDRDGQSRGGAMSLGFPIWLPDCSRLILLNR